MTAGDDDDQGPLPEPTTSPAPDGSSPPEGTRPKTESTAKFAIVAALVGFAAFGTTIIGAGLGVLALVLAATATRNIDDSNGALGGRGLVTASRILAVVDIVLLGVRLVLISVD